ncbi:MAG: HPr family phosphocarrier protein [Christensenellaceae bacterium]|nr:HPr family phosphocarrier protein [Christensenellaceae bacterium]
MYTEKKITKANGLIPEHCAVIAQAAGRFNSEISIIKGNKKVNAKSIMGLISLNIKKDDRVFLSINGDDEKEALEKLLVLL